MLPPVRFFDLSNEVVAVTQLLALQCNITICHHKVEPSDTKSQPVDRPDADDGDYDQQQPSEQERQARQYRRQPTNDYQSDRTACYEWRYPKLPQSLAPNPEPYLLMGDAITQQGTKFNRIIRER
jgi:hypothetical protein